MQRSVNNLVGCTVDAKDCELGKVNEFYFDDITWSIRYLVVKAGYWMSERILLIPQAALGGTDWKSRRFHVNFTMKQVSNSPKIDTEKPIYRQNEIELFNHYSLQYYWENGFYTRPIRMVPFATITNKNTIKKDDDFIQELQNDQYLLSTNKVKGYYIHANDGEIGHVEDYILDDENWNLRFLIVDTHNWQPGKKVLILPRWINRIDSNESKVYLNLSQESIKNIPEFDPSQPIGMNYETELFNHYRNIQVRVDKTGLFLIEK
ncbi:MAG: PRC-barrel domain-containing protein [Ignavibacteriaceae bacterium]|jgi:uncharacterized protein YrrD